MRRFLWVLNFILPWFTSRYYVPAIKQETGEIRLVCVPPEVADLVPRYIKVTSLVYWNTAILQRRRAYQRRQ